MKEQVICSKILRIEIIILSFYFVSDNFPSWCGRNWVISYLNMSVSYLIIYWLSFTLRCLFIQNFKIFEPKFSFFARTFSKQYRNCREFQKKFGNFKEIADNIS